MMYSMNCQAVCDGKGEFIDAEVKWPKKSARCMSLGKQQHKQKVF